jgi:EAL domain-containing protein (putative c-di-GMP-specific phosphodiesterase class I)
VGLAGSRPDERRRLSSLESLLKHADLAMCHAKTLGRGRVSQFDRELLLDRGAMQRKQARHYIERRLRTAIHDGGLGLHYQPLVDLASGRIIGAEALARWQDGELGDVPPDEFISVAEESGLIVDLGSWALETACRQAVTWPAVDHHDAPGVAVDVSAVQIAQPSFIGEVITVLQVSGLSPARLCLEITETAAIGELEPTAQRLRQLRDLGVRIALDDFSTGFSSLTMLRRLPVNIVKIDKSFIDRITLGANDAALVRLLIDAAHSFGLTVCAEGVEQLQQAEQLSMMGCDLVQGWLIAKGLPSSAAFAEWLPTLISRP